MTLARNPDDASAEGEGDEEADENQQEPDDEAEEMQNWQRKNRGEEMADEISDGE